MPIYHFIVDYTCEKNRNSRLDTKSTIIVKIDNYKIALEKVHNRLENRLLYTGNISDYNINIDWIEPDLSPLKVLRDQ